MRAILSGQAGLAVLGDDDAVWVISVEAPEDRTPCNWRDAPYLLVDADDVVELPDVSQEKALDELEQAWRRDRSLQLMLILLDREEDVSWEMMLLDGSIDAACMDGPDAERLAATHEGSLWRLPETLAEEHYACAVALGNDTLLASVNRTIERLNADGTLTRWEHERGLRR